MGREGERTAAIVRRERTTTTSTMDKETEECGQGVVREWTRVDMSSPAHFGQSINQSIYLR